MLKNAFASIIALLAVGTLVTACNSSTSAASSGVTQAQMTAAIAAATAPLGAEIRALQSQVASAGASAGAVSKLHLAISHGTAQTALARGLTRATGSNTTSSASCAWTLTGHPNTSDPLQSADLSGITCTGYQFNVSEAGAGANGHLEQLNQSAYPSGVIFGGPGCTGSAYLPKNSLSTAVVASGGAVFVMDTSVTGTSNNPPDYTNAANYWYTPAGESAQNVSSASAYFFGGNGCMALTITTNAYPVLPQPAATNGRAFNLVTGLPSALIPGPVLSTTAAP